MPWLHSLSTELSSWKKQIWQISWILYFGYLAEVLACLRCFDEILCFSISVKFGKFGIFVNVNVNLGYLGGKYMPDIIHEMFVLLNTQIFNFVKTWKDSKMIYMMYVSFCYFFSAFPEVFSIPRGALLLIYMIYVSFCYNFSAFPEVLFCPNLLCYPLSLFTVFKWLTRISSKHEFTTPKSS